MLRMFIEREVVFVAHRQVMARGRELGVIFSLNVEVQYSAANT